MLALVSSSGAYAIVGCGKPLELANTDGPSGADAMSADGSVRNPPGEGAGGSDGGSPQGSDGGGQQGACRGRPLRFGDLERLDYTGVTGVLNPFVVQGEQLFFGEIPTAEGNDAVVGRRKDGKGFEVERALTPVNVSEEITPAGFKEDELFYRDPGVKRLWWARKVGPGWQVGQVQGLGASPAPNDRWPSLTADGTLLVFHREDANGGRRLVEASRSGPGADFGNVRTVSAGAMPPGFSYPAITPDGLGLIFTVNDKTHYVERESREKEFTLTDALEVVIEHGTRVRARSMSADGCRLYVTAFGTTGAEIHIAKRK